MSYMMRKDGYISSSLSMLMPPTGDFTLNGFPHHTDTLTYLKGVMLAYNDFYFNVATGMNAMRIASSWMEYIIPTPKISQVGHHLMKEEAWLLGRSEYVFAEHLRMEKLCTNEIDVLAENEKALLHGYETCEHLQFSNNNTYLTRKQAFIGTQMNKLLIYQLVRRTIVRVNRRCTLVRQEKKLPPDVETIVCDYLGEAPERHWHGASYDDMWDARVQPSKYHHSFGPPYPTLLELPENHDNSKMEYAQVGQGFWDMPPW